MLVGNHSTKDPISQNSYVHIEIDKQICSSHSIQCPSLDRGSYVTRLVSGYFILFHFLMDSRL